MKKGFALITVLAVLIMIALGTATILQSVGSQTNMKSNNLQEVKNQYLAEAGMQYAQWVCRANNGNCSSAAVTLAKATTGLEQDIVIRVTETPAGSGIYQIKSEVDYTNV